MNAPAPSQSITKEGLALPNEDRLAKKREQAYSDEFAPVTAYLKKVYGDKVEKVTVSNRLTGSPCILVTSQYGYSANMERWVMRRRALRFEGGSGWVVCAFAVVYFQGSQARAGTQC